MKAHSPLVTYFVLLIGAAFVLIGPAADALPLDVSIASPTNNRAFFDIDSISVVSEASAEIALTNVQILLNTNVICECTNAPCFVVWGNLVATNPYSFFAIATDEFGNSGTSGPVSISIKESLPVLATGPITLNRQTGLFQTYVLVSNATSRTFTGGIRLFIDTGSTTSRVFNATGTNAPTVYFIDVTNALATGMATNILVQLYVLDARMVPTLHCSCRPRVHQVTALQLSRLTVLSPSNRAVVRFTTMSNCLYYLQASRDLKDWKTIPGLTTGTRASVVKTNAVSDFEFFRVLTLP